MIETIQTYLNRSGYPMLRSCKNCKHWEDTINLNNENNAGYCKFQPLYFAYTLQPSVYMITKHFYLCEKHEFINEIALKKNAEKVSLKESIKNKSDIKY